MLLVTASAGTSSCTSALQIERSNLARIADSLAAEIAFLHEEGRRTEMELWKTKYEVEYLRNAIVRADADSVKEFFRNFVFRFRRPIQAWVEPDRSSPFGFPLNVTEDGRRWVVPIVWGRLFYFDYNHLGVDLFADEGDTVRAIFDGIITNYDAAPGYGELVVVIEHEYTGRWKSTTIPGRFLSIYGHLRPRSNRDSGATLLWKNGDRVRKGDVIGFVNDDEHNGDGDEHLHLGIRIQTAEEARKNGKWLRGYDDREGSQLRFFINPMELFGRLVRLEFPE